MPRLGPKMRKVRYSAGFSFVEMLVVVGVLGFTLVSLLVFFVHAAALNESCGNLTTATSHAQYVLEEIRNAAFVNVPSRIAGGDWNLAASGISSRGMVPLKNETISTVYSGAGLITVMVTVSWNEASGRARSFQLVTQMGGA